MIAVLDPHAPLGVQLHWVLRVAAARQLPLCCVHRGTAKGQARAVEANEPETDAVAQKVLPQLRAAIERTPGFRFGTDATDEQADGGSESASDAAGEHAPLPVDLTILHGESRANELMKLVAEREAQLLLLVFCTDTLDDGGSAALGRHVVQRAGCEVVLLRVPQEEPHGDGTVLVTASRSPGTRAAMRFARAIAAAGGARLRPVYIEPPIGDDAEPVGRRVVDGVLERTFGKDRDGIEPLIVIEKDVARGIERAHETADSALIVLGISGSIALGNRFQASMARRMMKRLPGVAIAAVREALPLGNRLRQVCEDALSRLVPQLERENRVALAERVQSNSSWDFDFIALISLSTLIAAIGLVQSSAAVVIGAMLVAPLMTPILGVGLALVHGNGQLVRLAFRSILFGVATAWLLGLLVGLLDPMFHEPSAEMLARGWPGLLDLEVAFLAGLAAAYATSRPNLLAALPGVAIAAALVPPIATSGLAMAIGYHELSLGAGLLFVTNMVAIVLASSVALWAVGIRSVKGASRWTRIVGNSLIGAALVLAIYLSTSPPRTIRIERLPRVLATALADALPAELHLREFDLTRSRGEVELLVRVGGATRPDATLANRLHDTAAPHFDLPVRVRLVADYEVESGN